MATDAQLHHVVLLCKAALNAARADSCIHTEETHPYAGAGRYPALYCYWDAEDITAGPRKMGPPRDELRRDGTIKLVYQPGPREGTDRQAASELCKFAVGKIAVVLDAGHLATYEDDDDLNTLAEIENINVTRAQYETRQDRHPEVTITVACEHYESRDMGTAVTLDDYEGEHTEAGTHGPTIKTAGTL
jgi:hypothetical protein